MKKTISKVQKVSKKILNFISSQAAGSSYKPLPQEPNEDGGDDDDDDDDTQP